MAATAAAAKLIPSVIFLSDGGLAWGMNLDPDHPPRFQTVTQSRVLARLFKPIKLPRCSPNLNAFAERLVGSIIAACLSHFILFGELSLKPAIKDYLHHYHQNASIKAEALCH